MIIQISFYVAVCRMSNITDIAKYCFAFSFMVRQLNLFLLDLCKKTKFCIVKFYTFLHGWNFRTWVILKMLWCVYWFILTDTLIIRWRPDRVVGVATGYELDGPGIESRWGARFSALVQAGPGTHPASCTMGTGSFSGAKSGRDVTLTPHPLLVPWSWKSRAIPLLPLWAVRPVQSLSACTRVRFTFNFFIIRWWYNSRQTASVFVLQAH